ncbi:MAG TPA: hypothetical protein VE993_20510 [Stellaceae bacterium]|nr:hypothetical protein [Stellaceae bacterium]
MARFDPRPACAPHHFEIACDARGRWVVRDREGLVGGVFLTRRDAVRFALGEVAGDAAYVHIRTAPPAVARGGS